MNRYFLEVSYLGKAYSGFQVQQNAATVQSEVERVLKVLTHSDILLTGSSRTDAGVHARQNYFHFDTGLGISPRQVYNMNALLPMDISVQSLRLMPSGSHCRFDAVGRTYRYVVSRRKDPFLYETAYFFPYRVDVSKMQEAADYLIGTHDFSTFSKRNTQVKTFICTIRESKWDESDFRLQYTVSGNRFLRGMVRGLVGTMLKVGTGRMTLETFREVFQSGDCSLADFSVPGKGLCLDGVEFPANYFPDEFAFTGNS